MKMLRDGLREYRVHVLIVLICILGLLDILISRMAFMYMITFLIGILLTDIFIPEGSSFEKFIIGIFFGPLIMGFLVLYINIYFGVKITHINSFILILILNLLLFILKIRATPMIKR